MKRLLSATLLLTLTLAPFSACKKDESDSRENLKRAALELYAQVVYANYDDVYATTSALKTAIDGFVANPTPSGFQSCKDAWLAARNVYGQSEAFRFYGGPIDGADGPEGLINAWPMDENFIDYVQGNPNAGLINNPAQYPSINKETLSALNESISETSIFTGWHAIEFLLWGQDLSASGPGERPYTDYVEGGTAGNQQRRGQYLKAVADLLLENIAAVRDQWTPGGSYRRYFLQDLETKESLGNIFSGLGEFTKGELSGERMFVAIDTKDQEHEHSCFSDNTIADLRMNFLGAKNVYFGAYNRHGGTLISGNSFDEVVERYDPIKAKAVRDAFTEAETRINAIPAPFDQTIVNNTAAVLPAIDALRTLSDRLVDAGLAIGAEF